MSNHGVYLSGKNDSDGFRLPINPEEINVKRTGDGETFKIAKLGSVNVPKAPDLDEFELESYFPSSRTHYSTTDYRPPKYYLDKLNKWFNAKEPIRYIYVNGSFSINLKVTIENFEYKEAYGSADVEFTLELKKFVEFGPRKLKIQKPTNKKKKVTSSKKPTRQTKKVVPQTYRLKKGDSLWKVARKYTGKGSNYPALAKLNGIKPSQYRRLPIGLKLKIPPAWTRK